MASALRILFGLLLAIVVSAPLDAEPWSRFRGPNGSGVSGDAGFPTEFGPSKNLVWKTKIRAGKSSPILNEDHLFLTSATDEKLTTHCFDRTSGKLLWESSIDRPRQVFNHPLNEPAAASAVTDGENVYSFFEDWGLVSYDSNGKLRWKTALGPFSNNQGIGTSPIFFEGRIFLQIDQAVDSYIAAFDATNGETVWQATRSEHEGWATPIIYDDGDHAPQLLTVGDGLFGAHETTSGKRTLNEFKLGGYIVASPALEGNVLIAFGYNIAGHSNYDKLLSTRDANGDGVLSAGEYTDSFFTGLANFRGNQDGIIQREEWGVVEQTYGGPSRLSAVRLKGIKDGDVQLEELWNYERSFQSVIPSPLLYRGVLYFVKNGGIFTAMNAQTGEMLKQGRLRDAIDGYSASPVAADGKIFVASEGGRVSVVAAGGDWETLAVNKLEGEIFATPALSGGKIFVRTSEWLYCFGQ
jgi:outer membrane protein assembly factor BamB